MLFQIEAQALVSYLPTSPNAHLHFYVFCSPTESLPSNSSWRAVQFYSSDCCLMTPDNKALFLEMSATWQPGRELLLSGMNQLSRSKELQARACQPISSKQPLPALHLRSERAHLSDVGRCHLTVQMSRSFIVLDALTRSPPTPSHPAEKLTAIEHSCEDCRFFQYMPIPSLHTISLGGKN